jgi:hypothetical protein
MPHWEECGKHQRMGCGKEHAQSAEWLCNAPPRRVCLTAVLTANTLQSVETMDSMDARKWSYHTHIGQYLPLSTQKRARYDLVPPSCPKLFTYAIIL